MDHAKDGGEGVMLGFSDTSNKQWTSTPVDGPIMTRERASKLWDGSEILFVVAAAKFNNSEGKASESHSCWFLQPFSYDYPELKGKPMPENISMLPTWHSCGTYNSPIDIK